MTSESVYDSHKEGQKSAYLECKKVDEYWFENDIGELRKCKSLPSHCDTGEY